MNIDYFKNEPLYLFFIDLKHSDYVEGSLCPATINIYIEIHFDQGSCKTCFGVLICINM